MLGLTWRDLLTKEEEKEEKIKKEGGIILR